MKLGQQVTAMWAKQAVTADRSSKRGEREKESVGTRHQEANGDRRRRPRNRAALTPLDVIFVFPIGGFASFSRITETGIERRMRVQGLAAARARGWAAAAGRARGWVAAPHLPKRQEGKT